MRNFTSIYATTNEEYKIILANAEQTNEEAINNYYIAKAYGVESIEDAVEYVKDAYSTEIKYFNARVLIVNEDNKFVNENGVECIFNPDGCSLLPELEFAESKLACV